MRLRLEVGGRLRSLSVERRGGAYVVSLDGRTVTVEGTLGADGRISLRWPETGRQRAVAVAPGAEPGTLEVRTAGVWIPVRLQGAGRRGPRESTQASGPERIAAPMPGRVVRVLVAPGDTVSARQPVIVVEAMKMENELRAARGGTVREVLVAEGAPVDAGAPLVVIA